MRNCAIVAAVGFDSTRHQRIVRFAHTDSTGSYVIGNLPKIPYFVIAWARGYKAELYDNVHRFEDATQVTPDASGINFALSRKDSAGHSIVGVIRSGLGTPLSGAAVNVSSLDGSLVGSAVSLPDGGFIMEGLAPGTYSLSASSETGAVVSQNVDLSGGSQNNIGLTLPVAAGLRGDVNGDGVYTGADVVIITNEVFLGRSQAVDRAAVDMNCDGILTGSDVVIALNLVFLGRDTGVCGF